MVHAVVAAVTGSSVEALPAPDQRLELAVSEKLEVTRELRDVFACQLEIDPSHDFTLDALMRHVADATRPR